MQAVEIDLNSLAELESLQLHQYHSISILSGNGKMQKK